MKCLALDTSTSTLSLSLFQEGELLASRSSNITKQHGEHMLNQVAQILDQAQWQANQLDALYFGQGPGSYTGLRIGATMAKVWAKNLGCSLYACSSLALMAGQIQDPGENLILVPLMDARRGTAYTGAYQWQAGQLVQLVEDQHVDWQEWVESTLCPALESTCNRSCLVFITTDGWDLVDLVKDQLVSLLPYHVITEHHAWPDTRSALIVPHEEVQDIDTFTPFYAHLTLAEQEWAQRNAKEINKHEKYVEQTNETNLS